MALEPVGFRSKLPELDIEQASILAIKSTRTIRRLIKRELDPMPYKHLGIGRPLLFELEPLVRWLERERLRDVKVSADGEILDLEQERARLARAQRELTEQTKLTRSGELIPKSQVVEGFSRLVLNARSYLLSIGNRIGAIYGVEVGAAVDALVHEALTKLSGARP